MKFAITVMFAAALAATPGHAFTSPMGMSNTVRNIDTSLFVDPSELTEYMAKAHEEKLKAVKQAEAQKESEIQALKKQIEEMKQAPPAGGALAAPSVPVGDMTQEQMATKLLSYQQFMAKYIVEAQQEKMKAVQAAELAMKNKYEEKLKLLGASPSAPAPAPAAPVVAAAKETTVFDQRNAKVAAAAKAGKSRWGDAENAKAAQSAASAPSIPAAEPINGVVEANSVALSSDQSLFDMRNRMVSAAGKAGKSRWGAMEVAKATKLAAALPSAPTAAAPVAAASAPVDVPVPPEVAAADHGLRNDGGVSGPSLAERINLGAQLLGAATPVAPDSVVASISSAPSLYDKRNARVAAAGKAGKSRWGAMEIKKAGEMVVALPASNGTPAPVPVSPEVVAADHGLRNDGGVGGPSLADRVNLGASLIGQ